MPSGMQTPGCSGFRNSERIGWQLRRAAPDTITGIDVERAGRRHLRPNVFGP
jgi:hypothetical protein